MRVALVSRGSLGRLFSGLLLADNDELGFVSSRLSAANDVFSMAASDPSLIGKGAETIVRDRATGGKVDVKLERLKQREAEAKRIEEEEKYLKWGKVRVCVGKQLFFFGGAGARMPGMW
jgi:hypothetical protein